jgi:hypothetical protein
MAFSVYAILSAMYAAVNLVDGGNYTTVFFTVIAGLCAYRRGFFQHFAKAKIAVIAGTFLALLCTQLRYGTTMFLQSLADVFATLLFLAIILLLLANEIRQFMQKKASRILELRLYPDLTERDRDFVRRIFAYEKFDTIARVHKLQLSTVKNRMRVIYQILDVVDKKDMLMKYTSCE